MKASTTIVYLATLLCLAFQGCDDQGPSPSEGRLKTAPVDAAVIVAMGDSLTAGLGVAEEETYPAILRKMLHVDGYPYRVINAGISGETSSGALARLAWVMKQKPVMVILETGANDGLRGIDPTLTHKNIDEIVATLKNGGIAVILCGMKMLPNLGHLHGESFADIYPAVAARHDVSFMPFFLEGVAGEPDLNQTDGIHPNAEGYSIIVRNLYPYVIKELMPREQ